MTELSHARRGSLGLGAQVAGEGRLREAAGRVREMALAAFMRAYPFVHMAQEGLTFSYQLAYLLQSSPYFLPGLHLLGQHVVRTSAQEQVNFKFCCLNAYLQQACVFYQSLFSVLPQSLALGGSIQPQQTCDEVSCSTCRGASGSRPAKCCASRLQACQIFQL